MKKIIFIIGTMGGGGAERVVSILSDVFTNRGYKVSVITIYGIKQDYSLNTKVTFIPIECKSKVRTLRPIERILKLRRFYKTSKPDIVISFLADVNIHALIAGIFLKTKIIVSERNDPNSDPESPFIQKIRNVVYRLCDGFVFQTPDAKRYFDKIVKNKSTIIPNPIKDNLPERYIGIRRNEIVTACRLNTQKNLKMLIDAFAKIQKYYNNYILTIYGEGPLREELERYCESLGLSDKVFLPGFSSNLHQNMLMSKMFVITSNYEGISNSMLEALAIGLPVVATDCPVGGARMFIESGNSGVLVNIGDVEALSEAMLKIISDEGFSNFLSKNAVNIRTQISIEKITDMWIDFIGKFGE